MTRNQRRKVAARRQADKVERMASAEMARRNAAIVARNVGALRHGVRFETSGDLSPRAYRDFGRHSGTCYVMGQAPSPATPFVRATRDGNRNLCPR